MSWYLLALALAVVVLSGAAGWTAGVWYGSHVAPDPAERWYAEDPNQDIP